MKKLGNKKRFNKMDVNDKKSVEKLNDLIKNENGGINVLVNNDEIE
jgi:short-subunit dehydrogenase involved in D-alanine esterification of teichoic acids